MKLDLLRITYRICLLSLVCVTAAPVHDVWAQDASEKKPAQAKEKEEPKADEAKEEPKEDDPFAVPDGDAKELFAFISGVRRKRATSAAYLVKQVNAVAAACEKIRAIDGVSLEDEVKALKEQLGALAAAGRYDPPSVKRRKALIETIAKDERPEIVRIYAVEDLRQRAAARNSTKEEATKLKLDLLAYVKEGTFDRAGYTLANAAARSLGTLHAEVAAEIYDEMSVLMAASEDEALKTRAGKMKGAARQMRLPGNFMEVTGTTADGDDFDWAAYRGKVVLVDFWASWCGPCRAEVPNMKKALEIYGDRGFAIVGVNLDKTQAAYDKYVKREEIPWVSLMSQKEEERGWDNPLANYYGITGIPTAILVDKEGKVVSLRARGPELSRMLEEMLGKEEPATESGAAETSEGSTEASDADKSDAE